MKNILSHIKRFAITWYDLFACLIGALAIVLSFTLPGYSISNICCYLAGILGVVYVGYALWLWFISRVRFDWHLMNGAFLFKVVALVLLIPFTATIVSMGVISNTDELVKSNSNSDEMTEVYDTPECSEMFWSVYYHFIDPGNQHMSDGLTGRAWAALVAILGVFLLNGLLVSSIIGWIDQRRDKWHEGRIRYKRRYLGKYRFAVVVGANELAASVISNLLTKRCDGEINYKCEGNNRYVIVQTSRDVPTVRKELESHLSEQDMCRVIIYQCNRDSVGELQNLHIRYATEIYVLGESTLIDGGESFHDSMNMRCVNLLASQLEKSYDERVKEFQLTGRKIRRTCRVMLEYQTTYSVIQFSDIMGEVKRNLEFLPFNRYESWARRVMVDGRASEDTESQSRVQINYTPLDGESGISKDADDHVHFVVIGMSKMGVAMGTQAILQAHYLNYANAELAGDDDAKAARRTRITFIDAEADKQMSFFKGRYENLFGLMRHRLIDTTKEDVENESLVNDYDNRWTDPMQKDGCPWKHLSRGGANFLDLEVEFIKGDVESEGVRSLLRHISDRDNRWAANSKLTIAICMPETHKAVAAALYMPVCVYKKVQEIWVYQRESADIIMNLMDNGCNDLRYKRLRPFGMLYGAYMSDRSQYLKAILVNGAYHLDGRTYASVNRDMANERTYDDVLELWATLTIDKQYSNIYFVDAIPQKLRAIADNAELNSTALAVCEHNRWNVQQLMLGYSPCTKDIDDEFQRLNANSKSAEAKQMRDEWRIKIGWNTLSPLSQLIAKQSPEYMLLAHGQFDERKRLCKEDSDRMHPNICEYSHLDDVDYGAKNFDLYLNNAIPKILEMVGDHSIVNATTDRL